MRGIDIVEASPKDEHRGRTLIEPHLLHELVERALQE